MSDRQNQEQHEQETIQKPIMVAQQDPVFRAFADHGRQDTRGMYSRLHYLCEEALRMDFDQLTQNSSWYTEEILHQVLAAMP